MGDQHFCKTILCRVNSLQVQSEQGAATLEWQRSLVRTSFESKHVRVSIHYRQSVLV